MGAEACLEGFGQYSKKIAEEMDYPEEWYEDTPEGTYVMVHNVCGCCTTFSSEQLAQAVGVHPTEPSTWAINKDRVNYIALEEMAEEGNFEGGLDEVIRLRRLIDEGFTLFYQPNA